MTGRTRGQMLSLDFLLAMAVIILAVGVLLNHYDILTTQGKESRVKSELNTIAQTASQQALEKNADCASDFSTQGYKIYGCTTSNFSSLTKNYLLVPEGFSCYVTLDGGAAANGPGGCESTDAPLDAKDVAVAERKYLSPNTTLSKQDYEKCITGPGCTAYTVKKLRVKIWR